MNDAEFKIWCSQITKLTSEQRIETAVKLRVLSEEKTVSEDWLFDGICAALVGHGLLNRLSIRPLKQTKAFTHYQKYSVALQASLLDLISGIPQTRLSRVVLARVAGETLITWCKRRHEQITPALILNNISHTIDALNRSFPGYLEAGLLGKAIISPERMFKDEPTNGMRRERDADRG